MLALGLSGGALITLVSLFNALFWRELPVTHPEELVGVTGTDRRAPDWESIGIPESLFASLDRTENVFQGFAGFVDFESTAVIKNTNHRLAIEGVTGAYFETLGVRPELGQTVGGHEVATVLPVATISFRCWQTRFGADRNVIGQTFRLKGELMTVIGVAPRAFAGLEVGAPADAWVPASLVPRLLDEPPNLIFFDALVGRARPGLTLQHARQQLELLWPPAREAAAAAVAASLPEARDGMLALQPRVESAARGFSAVRVFYRRTLVLLLLSSAIAILLSCANLSGLLLARWSTRANDLAVQAALGASTRRLVAQVVGESLALSMLAVTLSIPLALWSAKSLAVLLWNQPDVPPLDLSPDYRVLGVMVVLAGVVAVCVSLLPASRLWSGNLTLTRGTRGLPGPGVSRWGRRLVAAQVALSVPLLVTAWTVAANLHRLEGLDPGFRSDGVVVASLTNRGGVAPASNPSAYLKTLAATLRATPGIAAAALSWREPVSGIFGDRSRLPIVGGDGSPGVKPFVEAVSPGYFETLSVPLLLGRDFTWTDDSGQRDVAIVSAGFAKAVFPGVDPVGHRVRLGGRRERLFEVIGVVADARLAEPHELNQLFLFTALLQESPRLLEVQSPEVLLKSSLPPRDLEALVRRAIVALGQDDIFEAHSLQHTIDAALLRERLLRLGALYFAGLTTLLVFVGLYAILNLGIVRRIPEIGLRIALGASTHDIRMMVIRDALVTGVAGLVVGIPCAFFSGRLVASSLTLVGPHDVLAFGAAITVIFVVTLVSLLIPLRRATNVSPVEALGGH